MIDHAPSRRRFLASAAAGCLTLLGVPVPHGGPGHRCAADRQDGRHPAPRPDVDGSRVLTAEQLADTPSLVPLFDGIRAIPHVADGLRCKCGCAALEGFRSLLSCYEGSGMATMCDICQTEGRMAIRLNAQGRTLDQIRRAIDARF